MNSIILLNVEGNPLTSSAEIFVRRLKNINFVGFKYENNTEKNVLNAEYYAISKSLEMESSTGLMDRCMRGSSKTTNAMETVLFTILAVRNLKDSGKPVRRMADASILGRTGLNTTSYM